MAKSETTLGNRLWSDIVEEELENEAEAIIIPPLSGRNKETDEKSSTDPKEVERESTKETNFTSGKTGTHPKPHLWSTTVKDGLGNRSQEMRHPTTSVHKMAENTSISVEGKAQLDNKKSRASDSPPSSRVNSQWTLSSATEAENLQNNQGSPRIQKVGRRAKDYTQAHPSQKLEIVRNILREKNSFLTQEKERRIAAEENCEREWKKLKDAELRLENEQQHRLDCENEIGLCKDIIEKMCQSMEEEARAKKEVESKLTATHMSALSKLEALKKKLQKKVQSNSELASKLKEKKEMTESFEWKLAELSLQLKSEGVNNPSGVSHVTPTSPAKEKIREKTRALKITVSTQTEACALKKVSKPTAGSYLRHHDVQIAKRYDVSQPGETEEAELVYRQHELHREQEVTITRDQVISDELAVPAEDMSLREVSALVEHLKTHSFMSEARKKSYRRKRRHWKRKLRSTLEAIPEEGN